MVRRTEMIIIKKEAYTHKWPYVGVAAGDMKRYQGWSGGRESEGEM